MRPAALIILLLLIPPLPPAGSEAAHPGEVGMEAVPVTPPPQVSSATRIPQSAIHNPGFELRNPQPAIHYGCSGDRELQFPGIYNPQSSRSGADLYPFRLSFQSPAWAWGGLGAGVAGRGGSVNLTVANGGDAASQPGSAAIRITDRSGRDMGSTALSLPSVAAGGLFSVVWTGWIPPYAAEFTAVAELTVPSDVNPANNRATFDNDGERYRAARWYDGADTTAGWSGDVSPAGWHTTTNIRGNPNPGAHTAPAAWTVTADDTGVTPALANLSLVSPPLDLTRMDPAEPVLVNFLWSGSSQAPQDGVELFVLTGTEERFLFARITGAYTDSWRYWVSHWNDTNRNGVVDRGDTYLPGLDLTMYAGTTVRLKLRFTSDASINYMGFYLDDFVLWGAEHGADMVLSPPAGPGPLRAGEAVAVRSRVTNIGLSPSSPFQAVLTIANSTTYYYTAAATVPSLTPGSGADVLWEWTPPRADAYDLNITLLPGAGADDDAVNNWYSMRLRATAPGAVVLVVDDDGGPGNGGVLSAYPQADVEWAALAALDGASVPYDVATVPRNGDGPPAQTLSRYAAVVWLTGYDGRFVSLAGTLTPTDTASLASYLSSGGALLLSSQETMNDMRDGGDLSFARNSLGVVGFNPNLTHMQGDPGTPDPLAGNPGDPVGDGLLLNTSRIGRRPPIGDWGDILLPAPGAAGMLGNASGFSAVRYEPGWRSVFLAFEPMLVADDGGRTLLIRRTLEYLLSGLAVLELSPPPHGADPDRETTFPLAVSNGGIRTERVTAAAAGVNRSGWSAVVDIAAPVDIVPGGLHLFNLTVRPPEGEEAGETASVSVSVTTAGGGRAWRPVAVMVNRTAGVRFLEVQPLTAQPGDTLAIPVTLILTGNAAGRVSLSTGAVEGWPLALDTSDLLIARSGRRTVTLYLSVPANATSGNRTVRIAAVAAPSDGPGTPAASELGITVSVAPTGSVLLSPLPAPVPIEPLASRRFSLTVRVTGTSNHPVNGTVALAPSRGVLQGWSLSRAGYSIPVPGGTAEAILEGEVPPAVPGGNYPLVVRLYDGEGVQAASRSFTLTVLRPDLVWDGAAIVGPASAGGEERIRLLVRNGGTGPSPAVNISVRDAGEAAAYTLAMPPLPSLSTADVTLVHGPVAWGTRTFTAVIDPDGAAVELSRANNRLEFDVTGRLPDVSVESVSVEGPAGGLPHEGDVARVTVTLRERGRYGTAAYDVPFTISVDGTAWWSSTLSVAEKGTVVLQYPWPARAGTHRFSVEVDPPNATADETRTNNRAEVSIEVPGRAAPAGQSTPDGYMVPLLGALLVAEIAAAGALAFRMKRGRPAAAAPQAQPRRLFVAGASPRPWLCKLCGRRIEAGTLYARCGQCPARYHEKCAEEITHCQDCGEPMGG